MQSAQHMYSHTAPVRSFCAHDKIQASAVNLLLLLLPALQVPLT
jgi:hypothetical protein